MQFHCTQIVYTLMRTHLGWSSGKGNSVLRDNMGSNQLRGREYYSTCKRECHYVMELWHKTMRIVELM